MDTIGQRLKYLRIKSKVTQQEIADATGIQRGNIGKYENDIVNPSAETIIAYSDFFKVSTDWILTGKGTGPDSSVVYDEIHESDDKQIDGILTTPVGTGKSLSMFPLLNDDMEKSIQVLIVKYINLMKDMGRTSTEELLDDKNISTLTQRTMDFWGLENNDDDINDVDDGTFYRKEIGLDSKIDEDLRFSTNKNIPISTPSKQQVYQVWDYLCASPDILKYIILAAVKGYTQEVTDNQNDPMMQREMADDAFSLGFKIIKYLENQNYNLKPDDDNKTTDPSKLQNLLQLLKQLPEDQLTEVEQFIRFKLSIIQAQRNELPKLPAQEEQAATLDMKWA